MKQLILATLMLVLTGPAFAGREGNGAGGYEYLNANGEKEYRLLDLYEAEVPGLIHPTGVKIVGSDKDVETQVMDAIGRIKQSGWESFSTVVLTQYHMFERYATDVPMDPGQPGRKLELKFPDDAFNIFATPVGYRPVGLASWNDELNRIFIDMDKVRRLRSNTERAALRVHEAVYRALRLFDVDIEDSRLARFIVGYLFSDMSPAEYPFAYRFMAMHTGFAGYDTGWRGLPVDYIVPFRAESVLKQALFIRVRAGSEYVGSVCRMTGVKAIATNHSRVVELPELDLELGTWVEIQRDIRRSEGSTVRLMAELDAECGDHHPSPFHLEFRFGEALHLPAWVPEFQCRGLNCRFEWSVVIDKANHVPFLKALRTVYLGVHDLDHFWGLYIPGTIYQGELNPNH